MSSKDQISFIKSVVKSWGPLVLSKNSMGGITVSATKAQIKQIDCFWGNDVLVNTYENGYIVGYDFIPYDELRVDLLNTCFEYAKDYERMVLWTIEESENQNV